jgi:hypothetical protein
MSPRAQTPHAINFRYERDGTVFGTTSLKTGRPLDGTMSTGREIRSYDYVNRPYERVRDALRQNALTVFQSAKKAAASRGPSRSPLNCTSTLAVLG